jgi:hypothetical protein
MVQPTNPIVGGTTLRIPAIQSPNFASGTSGWSINADGTAEFNGLTLHGTLVLGTGADNIIILDFGRRAIFVYDTFGHLVDSIAASAGTDALGNNYQTSITSYLPGNVNAYAEFFGNSLILSTQDPNQVAAFEIVPSATSSGPGGDQPLVTINGATDHTSGAGTVPVIELFGANPAGTAVPFIRTRRLDAVAMDWLHQGIMKWSATGAANYAETWHALPLAPNWANQGAPFGNGSYSRKPDGTVWFTGAIAWTAAASNAPVQVCTALPADYRPTSQKRCFTINMPADSAVPQVEAIDIHTDGTVWITSFANGTGPVSPITLDGVRYPIDG